MVEVDQLGTRLAEHDPRQVGPYLLLRRLGSGGMGTVYLAHREGSARRVALKVIHPGLAAGDPLFRARFAREIAAAQRVEGSCTARVIDGDPDAPVPWMATEFVPGDTLAARVERDGPLPVAEVIQLAAGLAEALATVHRAGLIHRDLKPSNVILAADGPRVIDFGIAREVDATHLTQLGDQVGTVSYMSPEQAAGDPLTPATDVFSLGGVIHYAVTGDAPFGQGHPAVILHRIADLEPDLSRIARPDLRRLIAQCLAKTPAARPTAEQALGACTGLASYPGADLPPQPDHSTPPAPQASASPHPATAAPATGDPETGLPETGLPGTEQPGTGLPVLPHPYPPLGPPPPGPAVGAPNGPHRRRRVTVLLAALSVLLVGLVVTLLVQHRAVTATPVATAPPTGTGTPAATGTPSSATITPAPITQAPITQAPVAPASVTDTKAVSAAQVAACEQQHGLTQARRAGPTRTSDTGMTVPFRACEWPPPPGADPDGFSLTTLSDVPGPGTYEATGTTRADRISTPCEELLLSYDYGHQGYSQHQPAFRAAPGTVTDLELRGKQWTGDRATLSFYPARDEVVVLHNSHYVLADARCAR